MGCAYGVAACRGAEILASQPLPGTGLPNAPGPATVVALLLYLAGGRAQHLVENPALPLICMSYAAFGNL